MTAIDDKPGVNAGKSQGDDFARLLRLLGYAENDRIVLCGDHSGSFASQHVVGVSAAATAATTEPMSAGNVWFGVNPVSPKVTGRSRGEVKDVIGLFALYADLDYKVNGAHDEPTAMAIVNDLSAILGEPPQVIVYTGHGMQPGWSIDDCDVLDEARMLMRRWQVLVETVAEAHKAQVDNVFDLARVLRVPGTVNRKSDPVPVTAEFDDDAGTLTVERVHEAFDRYGIPTPDLDDLDREPVALRDGWPEATETCAYAAGMVNGWKTDTPKKGRHPWALSQAVRLACALRKGCVTREHAEVALDVLTKRYGVLCCDGIGGESRKPDSMGGKWRWALVLAEAKTDAEVDDELGRHSHEGPGTPSAESGYGHSNLTDGQLRSAALGRRMARDWHGRYIYVPQMGWHKWDGCRWAPVDDKHLNADAATWAEEFIIGLIRDNVPRDVIGAALRYRDVNQVAALVRGASTAPALLVDPGQLDAHPHLLNCPNGVVDLRDGSLQPSDPSLYFTKVTSVPYEPGYTHPDWDKALEALDEDPRRFLQRRLGQALYGQPPSSDELLLCHGGGENGKTTVLAAAHKAINDYAVMVPEEALIGAADQHPTVFMVFRGARLALLEETPEARHINTVRLKRVVGQPTMTGRLIGKDFVTFPITHTMFIATNYLPTVDETDHGTWRRLLRLDFPYRFCDSPVRDSDKQGDRGLRDRITAPDSGGLRAALAWMVAGAVQHHRDGSVFPPSPEQVVEATRDWRRQADTTWAFIEENLVFDQGACVLAQELFQHFTDWMKARGMRDWNIRTFTTRFGSHSLVQEAGVLKEETRDLGGLSRRSPAWSGAKIPPPPTRGTAWLGVRFRRSDEAPGEGGEGSSGGLSRGDSKGTPEVSSPPSPPPYPGDAGEVF